MTVAADPAYGVNTGDTSGQYNALTSSALASANPFYQIAGQLGSQVGNQVAAGQLGIAGAEETYGLTNAQQAISNEYNNTLAGYQMGQLQTSAAQLGLQGTSLAQQQQLLGTQSGIEQQQYGLQSQVYPEEQQEAAAAYGQQQIGFGLQQSQLGLQGSQLGLQGTSLGLQEQGLVGSEAAAGALTTKGSVEQQGYLGQQAQYLGQEQGYLGQQASALQSAEGYAGQQYGWQQADISRAQQEAQLGQQSTVAGQQYSQEQINTAQQNLSLLATANGMSEQEVWNQLAYQTANNQLQGAENPISLLNTIAGVNQGDLTGVENQLSPLGFAGNLNLFPG